MTPRSLAARPAVVALGALAAAALTGYGLAVVEAAWAMPSGPLAEALARGTWLGAPRGHFLLRTALYAALSAALAAWAIAGDANALGALSRTAWRRAALALTPLALAPLALTQDDTARRAPLVALCVGASAALGVLLRPGDAPRDDAEPARADRAAWLRWHAPAIAAVGLHAATFTWLAVERDRALWSATVDLGIFKEALWHTLHGRPLWSPTVGYSFLGEHFSPVLFALAPLYALWPTSACLLAAQTLAVSAGAWLLYRLGLRVGLGRALATALAAAMAFSPPMHTALLYDFHMDLLGVPFLLGLALALEEGAWPWAVASLAALLTVKEDTFLYAVPVLLARALTGDARTARRALAMAAAATAWCLAAMFVWMKRFGPPPGVPVYMADPTLPAGSYKFLRSYHHLMGARGPLVTLVTQPVRFALYALTHSRLTTALALLLPLGLAPLAAGRRALLLAPMAVVLLADNDEIVRLLYHYGAMQHPGVYAAAAFGMAALAARSARPGRAAQALAALVVAASAVTLGMNPASVWARARLRDAARHTPHADAVDRVLARLPDDAPVSVSSFVGARVSNRPWGVHFPNGLDRARWVAIDLQRPPWPLRVAERDEFVRALMRGAWGAVAWEDGALLLAKGHPTDRNAEALRDLFARRRYEVEGTEWTDFPGCAVADREASDGWARVVPPDDPRPAGWVVSGPGIRLMRGRYTARFRLRAEPWASRGDRVGRIDVVSRGEDALARRTLTAADFPDGAWRDVALDFEVTQPSADEVQLRVSTTKRWTLGADVIELSSPDEDALVRQLLTR